MAYGFLPNTTRLVVFLFAILFFIGFISSISPTYTSPYSTTYKDLSSFNTFEFTTKPILNTEPNDDNFDVPNENNGLNIVNRTPRLPSQEPVLVDIVNKVPVRDLSDLISRNPYRDLTSELSPIRLERDYPTKFSKREVYVNLNYGEYAGLELSNYLVDRDGPLSAYQISIESVDNDLECDIDSTYFECRSKINENFQANNLIKVVDIDLGVEDYMNVVFINSFVQQDVPVKFLNSQVNESLTFGDTFRINLMDLVNLENTDSDFDFDLVSFSENLSCTLENFDLVCVVLQNKNSSEFIQLSLYDYRFDEYDYLDINLDVSKLDLGVVFNTESLSKTYFSVRPISIDLDSVIETDLDNLQVNLEVVSGSLPIEYTLDGSNLNISFTDYYNSYIELKLLVSDGVLISESESFFFSLIDATSLNINVDSPSNTIENNLVVPAGVNFPIKFNVKNTFSFPLYNFEVKLGARPPMGITYDPNPVYVSYLPSNAELELNTNVNVPSLMTETLIGPTDFEMFLVFDDVYELDAGPSKIDLTVVPLDSTKGVSNYVNVTTFTPGERADGLNEYVPLGIMVGVPYRITHQFDVPLNINLCKVVTAPYFDELLGANPYTTHMYLRESSGFVEDSDGIHCELVSLEKETEGYIYSKVVNINGDFVNAYTALSIFLDTNPTLSSNDEFVVRRYTGISNTLPNNVIGSSYKYISSRHDEPLGNRTFYLRGGSSNRIYEGQFNATYNSLARFTNDYAYPIFDLRFNLTMIDYQNNEELTLETSVASLSGELEGYIEMIGARNSEIGNISEDALFYVTTKNQRGDIGVRALLTDLNPLVMKGIWGFYLDP